MNHLIALGRSMADSYEFGSRGVQRLKRRLRGKRNQVAQVQGAKSYKHAKELGAYGVMDDYVPVNANVVPTKGHPYVKSVKRGQLESPADIQQKIRRKKMEGMQRRRAKVLGSKRKTRFFNYIRKGGSFPG